MKQVEHRGVVYRTVRTYRDIDAYRDSVDSQFTADVLKSIQEAVATQPFGPLFSSQQELDDRFYELRFPGYGSFYANQLGAKLDPSLELMYVELPRSTVHRYFALERLHTGGFRVVADFTAAANPELVRVRWAGNRQLEFMTQVLKVVHKRNAA